MTRSFRIGIGALLVHPARVGGAETYARRLIERLPTIAPDLDFTIFLARGHDAEIPDAPNVRVVECPAPVANPYTRVLWEHAKFPAALRRERLDLVHFLGSTAPRTYLEPQVVTIHDTLRFQMPQSTPLLLGAYYGWIQREIARRGAHVLAVSEADAGVMRKSLKLPPERCTVAHLGVDERFFERGERRSPSSSRRNILWAGRPYAHKNLETLIAAHAVASKRLAEPVDLDLVGIRDSERAALERLVMRYGAAGRVNLSPPTPAAEMPDRFAAAKLFCFPSSVESFGLPVLEALACGTPAICSDLPVFREIYADAVRYAPLRDIDTFAEAIVSLLGNEAAWNAAVDAGLERARKFEWNACASATVEAYRRCLGVAPVAASP